ncbi:MAG: TldE/PmbA family protein, partial [Deltaproteobacteria bacterium]|nr:TldE/PmbA family protein [Deltaproteobacteria bacterium]
MLAEDAFFDLADHAARALRGGQSLLASLAGERTDFVRWNHARVRQATTVEQAVLRLTVLEGSRRDATSLTLSGVPEEDRARVASAVARLRSTLPDVPEDPYLLVSTEPGATRRVERGELPSPAEMVDVIAAAGAGTDLVGIASSGAIVRGFASSFGHRHWHEVESFQLDWSLHHDPARAVSTTFAAARWDAEALRASMDSAQRKLADLALPMVTPPPGAVRAWLSPAAMGELMTLLAWGGLSTKAQRTKTSALQRLADGEERLSPLVTLREATARGLAPAFDD